MNYWQIIAGVGVFLFGILLMENALKNLMSRSFKLFLKRHTQNPFKSILGGTVATAILQSSSAVNFMVLAFVSTGVMELRNAFAVIMGANLGTTITNWIVATVGFSMDIEQLAYPVAGLAGIAIFLFQDNRRVGEICRFLLGFSFLFIGLDLMKSAAENEVFGAWFERFAGSSPIVFLFLGFIATSITQSSSATVAITLSILNQQLIGFESSLAVVIGSEVGTAIKLVLGSLDGVAVKKRVSAGNLIYNIVTTVGAFVFLHPLAELIRGPLGIENPLFGLVAFQSLMNFFSLILFLPFLDPFSRFLEKLFTDAEHHVSLYLQKTKPTVPDAAIEMMKKEIGYFIHCCMDFGLIGFNLDTPLVHAYSTRNGKMQRSLRSFPDRYALLKELYGEINNFYIRLSRQRMNDAEIVDADQLMDAVRSAMYTAKCIKDVRHDVNDLENSGKEIKFSFLETQRNEVFELYRKLNTLTEDAGQEFIFNELSAALDMVQKNYSSNIDQLYTREQVIQLSDIEIATLMNFNRAVYTSNKSMVMAWKNFLLEPTGAERFGDIPTYRS